MLKFSGFATISAAVFILTTAASEASPRQVLSSPQLIATQVASIAPRIALANHLKQLGAKFYGTFWCPYCSQQKKMFGEQAFSKINYIECDERGKNPRPDLCRKASISGFPTWEINGKQYRGMKSLEELADLSGYRGERNFGN